MEVSPILSILVALACILAASLTIIFPIAQFCTTAVTVADRGLGHDQVAKVQGESVRPSLRGQCRGQRAPGGHKGDAQVESPRDWRIVSGALE